jgi:hypothetical protein
MTSTPRIELLHLPGCPLVDGVRATLEGCLSEAGVSAEVDQREGPFASPSLIINGAGVVTGAQARTQPCCRLDLPARRHILAALRQTAT